MASTYINRTSGTPTSNKTFTISYWVKRNNIGSAGNGHIFDKQRHGRFHGSVYSSQKEK